MNNTNNISARMSFDIAKEVLFKSWIDNFREKGRSADDCMAWVEGRKLSQGELRLEVGLSATTTIYTFAVTDTDSNSSNVKFNTERRLRLQDSLIANEYGIFVAKPASELDTAYQLRTYGNTIDFTAAAAAALDTQFYANGRFAVRVNNDVIVPYRGLYNHLYRGETQQTSALGAGSPGDQFRGAEDGFVTQEPNLLYIGSKGYVPSIELVNALATVDANSRIILLIRGVLAQNSTVIN